MKLLVACIALSISIGSHAVGETASARKQNKELRQPVPSPEPYDPQSGPFVILVEDDGTIAADQYGIMANAVDMWSGHGLQAFVICFRSPSSAVNWSLKSKAIDRVAQELKHKGASAVVEPAGSLCEPGSPRSERAEKLNKSYVVIMGVHLL